MDDDDDRGDDDAYARHFALVLRAVSDERPDLRKLLSARERALAAAFLTALAPPERRLFARLFQRKGPWFRVASLARYFLWRPYEPSPVAAAAGDGDATEAADAAAVHIEDDDKDASTETEHPDNAVVQAALHSLVAHGFLETLHISANSTMPPAMFAAAGDAVKRVESQEEDAGLALALEALQQCATAPELAALQKQLTGSKAKKKASPNAAVPSSSKGEAFLAVKKVVMTQRRIDGSRIPLASLLQQVLLESYPLAGKSKRDVLVVRMPDAIRDLFHRMHRLFYFQSSLPFTQAASSQLSTGYSEQEALEKAVARLQQEATQWPGLMVIFRKVAYPKYEISIRHHAFPSSEAYVCYEVASRLHYVMVTFEGFMQIETPEGAEPDLDIKWVAFDSSPQLLAFQKLVETDDDGFEILPVAVAAAGARETEEEEEGWQMESWRQFRVQLSAMTSLDDFVLESRRCFYAFLLWTKAQSRHRAGASSPASPVFFSKCNAGYHLARVLHHAAALYEKLRQYQVAVLLLNDLLDAPFLHRKRGHWWERLALNLEHLKCANQARSTCRNALKDVDVVGADRITISRRLRRLEKRLGGADDVTQEQPTQHKQRRSAEERDQDDFVVSLVSDNEDDMDGDDNGDSGGASVADTAEASVSMLLKDYEYPKEHIVGRPLNRQTAEKSRFIGYDDEPCTVEQLVLQFYHSQRKSDEQPSASSSGKMRGGWYGVHCEGRVIGNIFGLCMWDVLYASVPDVFQTRYQSAPLDFGYADAFYESRRELIDASLKKLEAEWSMEQILDALETTWRREYGKVSRFVSWPDESYLPLHFHQLVVLAMGQQSLARLMRYMLTSPEYHRAQNGLPDLLMVRVEPTASETSSGLIVDENGCLDVYALCKMTCELNLNGKPEETAVARLAVVEEDEPRKLLDRFKLDEWTLKLKLVEVKGPRDRLSDKQLMWLQVLNEDVGVETSVTHVVEDAKTLEKVRNPKKTKAPASKKTVTGASPAAGKKSVKRQKR